MKFAVGDEVVIARDNKYWNGGEAVVVEIKESSDHPYRLRFTKDPKNRPGTAGTTSFWGGAKLDRIKRGPEHRLETVLDDLFPSRVKTYRSDTPGRYITDAVVQALDGHLYRVWSDGASVRLIQ